MKLQLKNDPSRHFDLPREIAQILLLMPGSVVAEVPPPPVKRGVGIWQIVEGVFSGRISLSVSCSVCGSAMVSGAQKAHEQKFIHCGTSEACPPEVANQWREVFKRLEPGSGRLIRRSPSDADDPVTQAFKRSRVHCQI